MEWNWRYNWAYNCSPLHTMCPPDKHTLVSCIRYILNPLRSKHNYFLYTELALVYHFKRNIHSRLMLIYSYQHEMTYFYETNDLKVVNRIINHPLGTIFSDTKIHNCETRVGYYCLNIRRFVDRCQTTGCLNKITDLTKSKRPPLADSAHVDLRHYVLWHAHHRHVNFAWNCKATRAPEDRLCTSWLLYFHFFFLCLCAGDSCGLTIMS